MAYGSVLFLSDDFFEDEPMLIIFIYKDTSVAKTFFQLIGRISYSSHEVVTCTGM